MEIKENSRQIPKSVEICSNKKYYDILYAYLQCVSRWDSYNNIRFFEKKEVNFSKLAQKFNLSRQTISTKFKYLKEMGLVEELTPDIYKIIILEKNAASLIPYETLKLLVDALSENAISVYIYMLNRYIANGEKSFQFTLDQVKKYIGISTATRSNNDTITNILCVLQKIGLIEYNMSTLQQEHDSFQNIKTIYELKSITNQIGSKK